MCLADHHSPPELPSAPTGARLGITSGRSGDGKLTIGWSAPLDDGGDPVTHYVVSWDVAMEMMTFENFPHKGSVELEAATDMAHTISGLTIGRQYYVRVAAKNLVGAQPIAVPLTARPSLRKS